MPLEGSFWCICKVGVMQFRGTFYRAWCVHCFSVVHFGTVRLHVACAVISQGSVGGCQSEQMSDFRFRTARCKGFASRPQSLVKRKRRKEKKNDRSLLPQFPSCLSPVVSSSRVLESLVVSFELFDMKDIAGVPLRAVPWSVP